VVITVLFVDVVMITTTTVLYSLVTAVALGLTVGICQSLGKLSLDALIQREVPETVRTSVFARSETLLQLSWVVGGFVGILVPLQPERIGLGLTAGLLVVWLIWICAAVRRRPGVPRHRLAAAGVPPLRAVRRRAGRRAPAG
jgi:predicted branched-subunit amino acid permease